MRSTSKFSFSIFSRALASAAIGSFSIMQLLPFFSIICARSSALSFLSFRGSVAIKLSQTLHRLAVILSAALSESTPMTASIFLFAKYVFKVSARAEAPASLCAPSRTIYGETAFKAIFCVFGGTISNLPIFFAS